MRWTRGMSGVMGVTFHTTHRLTKQSIIHMVARELLCLGTEAAPKTKAELDKLVRDSLFWKGYDSASEPEVEDQEELAAALRKAEEIVSVLEGFTNDSL